MDDKEMALWLAIITLIVIGIFSAMINFWMWKHWKRTMGITEKIGDEILVPVSEDSIEPTPVDTEELIEPTPAEPEEPYPKNE